MSGSRQRKVCRESALGNGRPSAKPYLPRARPSANNSSRQPGPLPRVRPSAKKGRRQPVKAGKRPSPAVCFAEGQNLALGKELLCRVSFLCPRQNIFFFAFFASKFFPWVYCCTLKYILKFGAFFILLAIFNKFISFTWILPGNSNLNCRCIEYWNWVIQKIIFMVLHVVWDRIQWQMPNLAHRFHGTRRGTCV